MTTEDNNLETIIESDAAGVHIMKLTNELNGAAGEIKLFLNRGLPQGEAVLCQKNMQALNTANRVLEKIWSEQHSFKRRGL